MTRADYRDEAEDACMLGLPRQVAAVDRRLPEFVTQDSVFELFGIRPRTYLAFARAGSFAHTRRGRLRIARYADIRNFVLAAPWQGGQRATRSRSLSAPSVNWEAIVATARSRSRK